MFAGLSMAHHCLLSNLALSELSLVQIERFILNILCQWSTFRGFVTIAAALGGKLGGRGRLEGVSKQIIERIRPSAIE